MDHQQAKILYIGGNKIEDESGVNYDRPPITSIVANIGISFDELKQKFRVALELQENFNILYRNIFRNRFVTMPLRRDSDLDVLRMDYFAGNNHMKFYIETVRLVQRSRVSKGKEPLFAGRDVRLGQRSQVSKGKEPLIAGRDENLEEFVDDELCDEIFENGSVDDEEDDDYNENEEEEDDYNQNDDNRSLVNVGCGIQFTELFPDIYGPPPQTYGNLSAPNSFYDSIGGDGAIRDPREYAGDAVVDNDLLVVGSWYPTKEDFIMAVKTWHIRNRYDYDVRQSTPTAWEVYCSKRAEGCKWRIRGGLRQLENVWIVSRVGPAHSCTNYSLNQDHPRLDAAYMGRLFKPMVVASPNVKIAVLQYMINEKFGLNVRKAQIWAAKRRAISLAFGDWDESYNFLPRFQRQLIMTNPGSCVELLHDVRTLRVISTDEIFDRIFWSFSPCIEGFKYCRPIILIDGTHFRFGHGSISLA
jgi:hypothetical protein